MLPDLKADEILKLNLMLRGMKLKSGEINLQMQVGDYPVGHNSLKPNPHLWKLEIPGDVVAKHGRVAQIIIKKTFADSIVELQSIEVEISHK